MFCPKCRSEFRQGIGACANCEVDLVDDLPPADPFSSPEHMAKMLAQAQEERGIELEAVFVGNYGNLREWQSVLAEYKIASVMAGESADTAIHTGIHDRLFLMIAQDEVGRVRDIINERWAAGLKLEGVMVAEQATSPEQLDSGTCPACQTEVPSTEAECPECGLFIGSATDDSPAATETETETETDDTPAGEAAADSDKDRRDDD